MVVTLPDRLIGLRDPALLLVGFSGAFHRSELVSLDWRRGDPERGPQGDAAALYD